MNEFEEQIRSVLREREWDVPSDLDVLTPVHRRARWLRQRRTAGVGLVVAAAVVVALGLVPALLRPAPPHPPPPMSQLSATAPAPADGLDTLTRGPLTPIQGARFGLVPERLSVSNLRFWLFNDVRPGATLLQGARTTGERVVVAGHPGQLLRGPAGERCVFVYRNNRRGIVVSLGSDFAAALGDDDLLALANAIEPLRWQVRQTGTNQTVIRVSDTDPMVVLR